MGIGVDVINVESIIISQKTAKPKILEKEAKQLQQMYNKDEEEKS